MKNIMIKYQKLIDQSNKFYFTAFSAIIAFFSSFIFKESLIDDISVFLVIGGTILSVLCVFWLRGITTWNRLLKADIEYLKANDKKKKKYLDFIHKELTKNMKKNKEHSVMYPNYTSDIIPRIMLAFSIIIFIVGFVSYFIKLFIS